MSEEKQADSQTPEEGTEAAPDLDTLLKEFPEPEKTKEPEQKTEQIDPKAFADMRNDVAAFKKEKQDAAVETAVGKTVEMIMEASEDVAKHFGEKAINAMFRADAESNPELLKVFLGRESDPAKYKKVMGAYAKGLEDHIAPDRNLTENRLAAEAAARGVSNQEPESDKPDQSKENSAEFGKRFAEQYGGAGDRSDGLMG